MSNGFGFLRQDTIQGKAWFLNTFNNHEDLIMDLSLSVADTFVVYDIVNTPYTIYVDSVFYKNSLKHIRLNHNINICGKIEKLTFIEGSGTNAGVAYTPLVNWPYPNSYLLCHFKDGIKVYGNIFYNDACFSCYTGVNEVKVEDFFTISPNPTTSLVAFSSSEKISSIEVTDVLGNVVFEILY